MYSVYSLPDTHTVINHPKVGRKVISDENSGGGRVSISRSGDMGSHTTTANGYVIVNKLKSRNGTVSFEVPQNSPSDLFLRKLVAYVDNAPAAEFALATITIVDNASGIRYDCSGVSPQKRPDRQYDQSAGNLTYAFLVAEMTES